MTDPDTLPPDFRRALRRVTKALRQEFEREKAAALAEQRAEILSGLKAVAQLNGSGVAVLKAFVGERHAKAFDADKHPRGDDGRFIHKDDIAAAATDPQKAEALRAKVTDPEQRAKLDAAIDGEKKGNTPSSDAPADPPAAPPKKLTVDQSVALVRRLMSPNGPTTSETVRQLGEAFAGHSKAELDELKQRLGIRASGPKAEVARKLAERAAAVDRSNRNLYVNEKLSVDEAHARIKALAADGSLHTPAGIRAVAQAVGGGLTGEELKELKGRLGLKASGPKAEVARKLVERAVKGKKEQEVQPAQPGSDIARRPAELAPATGETGLAHRPPPDSVVMLLRDDSGQEIGRIAAPHDGTKEGMRAAAESLTERAHREFGTEWSNMLSVTGATDATGEPTHVISPNRNNVNPITSDAGKYTLGFLQYAPKETPALPSAAKPALDYTPPTVPQMVDDSTPAAPSPEAALRRIMAGEHPGYQHADITRALRDVEDAANGGPTAQPGKAGGDALRKLAASLGVPDADKGDWRSLRTRIKDHVQAGAVRAGKGGEGAEPNDAPTLPEPEPGATPRETADAHTRAADPEYAFARASAIGNMGEDLKGSARHRRNEWRGLADAEANGTAAEMVNRDTLLKADPPDLHATIRPHNAMGHLAAHWAMSAFPKEPGAYPVGYDRYKGRDGQPLPRTAPEQLRKQYHDAYQSIKAAAEKAAVEHTDPRQVLNAIGAEAKRQINAARGLDPNATGMIAMAGAPDPYNPVANALVDLHNRAIGSGYKKNHIMSRVHEFTGELKKKYGEPTADTLNKAAEHVKDILDGHTMNKTFGVTKDGKKYFSPAEAYVTHASRKGGRVIDAATVEAGKKHLIGNVGMRGIQWGNSVTDDERQHHLTRTAEALADLADATGLDDQHISLGGKLGLAIGARGKGTAMAHYEPGSKVINLTRKNGVGSLAHEWGHALDHELNGGGLTTGSDGKPKGDYLSADPRDHGGHPVKEAMKGVRKAMKESGFDDRLRTTIYDMMRAGELPRSNTPGQTPMDYWGSHEEKFARVFEKHVQHKLKGEGRENTYLSGEGGHKLWPTPEESAKIAPAMDALMAAVKAHHFAGN